MGIEILAIAAAVCAGPIQEPEAGWHVRPLATQMAYPAGMADDVRRPGFNGMLWSGRAIIGPVATSWPAGYAEPGAASYGASGAENQCVYARVGSLAIGLNPWTRIEGQGYEHLEAARQVWLKEQGYTGGVRTFVNEAYVQPARIAAAPIQPRATIRLPDDMPRFHGRMQVYLNGAPVNREVMPGVRVAAK